MKQVVMAGLMVVAAQANAQVLECGDGLIYLNRLAPVWYAPEAQGQGVTILYKDGGLWGYWTLYDDMGEPIWLLFTASAEDLGCHTFAQLYRFTGPAYLSEWDESLIQAEPWIGYPGQIHPYNETIQITFQSQNEIKVFSGVGGFASTWLRERFVPFN